MHFCATSKGVNLFSVYLTVWLTLYSKWSGSEIRLTALRFSKCATLPVKEGASMDIIPVIISRKASLSNKALEMGRYIHLTENVIVERELCRLVILAQ
jgi:hypothetical protein